MDNSNKVFRIDFQPVGKRVSVKENTTILEAAQKAGIALSSTCGGLGKCGQCRTTIMSGQASEATSQELSLLPQNDKAPRERLACVATVQGDMKIHIPPSSLVTEQRLQLRSSKTGNTQLSPCVQSYSIELSPPNLDDARSDFARVAKHIDSMKVTNEITAEPAVIRQLPEQLRKNGWRINAYLHENQLLGTGAPTDIPLGVAIDLGTTKIAASLFNLQTGRQLAVSGAMNPQIAYGEDLIARLTYAHESQENSRKLARKVRSSLQSLIAALLSETDLCSHQVADICIAGNTAMIHLLLEFPVVQLAQAPYVAATNSSLDIKARELGLSVAPGANVHIFGNIGGFVGGDHVAMILASRLFDRNHTVLGIDIGTNSEIVLYQPATQTITSLSCASGPAFEGGHIGDGMRAGTGAIESVNITDAGFILKTVDGAPPVGICGSGIIDAIAELLREGIINNSGRLDRNHSWVRNGVNGPEVVLVEGEQSGTGEDIVISQKDVSEIQLAKGAIKAGMDTLLAATKTPMDDVKELIVAGAFGSFLDLRKVLEIGMFPRFPNAMIQQVGNAALEGVKMALLSENERAQAKKIARESVHLESSRFPDYSRLFAMGMKLP